MLEKCSDVTFISLMNGYTYMNLDDKDFLAISTKRMKNIIENPKTRRENLAIVAFFLQNFGKNIEIVNNFEKNEMVLETAFCLKRIIREIRNGFSPLPLLQITEVLVELKAYNNNEEIYENLEVIFSKKEMLNITGYGKIALFFTNFPSKMDEKFEKIRDDFYSFLETLVLQIFQKKDKKLIVSNMGFFVVYLRGLILTQLYKKFPRMDILIKTVLNYYALNPKSSFTELMRIMPILLEFRLFEPEKYKDFFLYANLENIAGFDHEKFKEIELKSDKIFFSLCQKLESFVKNMTDISNEVYYENLNQGGNDNFEFRKKDVMGYFTIENYFEKFNIIFENEKLIYYMPVDIYIPNLDEGLRKHKEYEEFFGKFPQEILIEIQGPSHYGSGEHVFDGKTECKLRQLVKCGYNVFTISKEECYKVSQVEESQRFREFLRILGRNSVLF